VDVFPLTNQIENVVSLEAVVSGQESEIGHG